MSMEFRNAERKDTALILQFIRELADYEKMLDEVVADAVTLEEWIFDKQKAEVIFALEGEKEIGFALYFHNFSTFLGRAGIYLEDLYVKPEYRGKGYGKAILKKLASIAVERGCGRLEWWCLDWIPFQRKPARGNIFAIGYGDLKESFRYMYREQPVIMQFSLAVAAINMILSSLVIIGLPVIITQMLGFDSETANRFYGYAESVFAMGSLCGGMGAGLFATKIKARNGYLLLFYDALTLIPIGIAIMITMQTMISYIIILVSCFFMAFLSTLFSIQIMSYLQMIVPVDLIGKVISCAMCIGMCASPIGQAMYGGLFEVFGERVFALFFAAERGNYR